MTTELSRWPLVSVIACLACGPTFTGVGEDTAGTTSQTDPGSGSAAASITSGSATAPVSTTVVSTTEQDSTTGADSSSSSEDDEGPFSTFDCAVHAPPGTSTHCAGTPACDPYSQSYCSEGEKCVPRADSDGLHHNTTVCVEVVPDPVPLGEPCGWQGPPEDGLDTCDFGAMCYFVDPDTDEGVCTPLCDGAIDNPLCANPDQSCFEPIPVCVPTCDPLLPGECGSGQACVCPREEGNSCVCVVAAQTPAPYLGPCTFHGQCADGMACAVGRTVGCAGPWCCTPYCDASLAEPDPACPDIAFGQICTPLYEEGKAPGAEHIGICAG
ncbi:MAG: hypothetical protein JKY37_01555 [Nannocystaceae bacterium]|nr:hypothetical protein [Nannocystaceae bacterium]